MASPEAEAHIVVQERLRALTVQTVAAAWDGLPNYDEESVGPFLTVVVPLVTAAQRQSAVLTNAFLARELGRGPVDIDLEELIGPAVRNGTPPETVYRRPFVQTWTALKDHAPWEQAVSAGRERATGAAAMDVQNTMRHTLRAVGEADDLILGYRRVPDGDACPLCVLAAGRRYRTGVLMEIHTRCGCGVEVITAENRGDFFGKAKNDLAVAPQDKRVRIIKHGASRDDPVAAIAEHGELGPLLVDGSQNFAGPEVAA